MYEHLVELRVFIRVFLRPSAWLTCNRSYAQTSCCAFSFIYANRFARPRSNRPRLASAEYLSTLNEKPFYIAIKLMCYCLC